METRRAFKKAAFFLTILLNIFFYHDASALGNGNRIDQASRQTVQEKILIATVEIKMAITAGAKGDKIQAKGLASLVFNGGETLLVTHNHWGKVLHELTVIEFYGADGRLLKLMFGSDFQGLVKYQDAGTLVLKAPEELGKRILSAGPKPSQRPGKSRQVKAGDTVLVVYHGEGNQTGIGTLEAKVEETFKHKGLPAFKLRSLDGQPIQKGDSGGGIWFEGQLVGNLWATVQMEDATSRNVAKENPGTSSFLPTDISYGAAYPAEALEG